MSICKILKDSSDVWAYAHADGGYVVHVADVGVTYQHDGQQYRIYSAAELLGFFETLVVLGYKVPNTAIERARNEHVDA